MTRKERLSIAWSFHEADRVPIELSVAPEIGDLPAGRRIYEFAQNEADNLLPVPLIDWGFCGLPATSEEETLGTDGRVEQRRMTYHTAVGDFFRITQHYAHISDPNDYYWRRRFIVSLEDLQRLTDAPREPLPLLMQEFDAAVAAHGDAGLPYAVLWHPLGILVRLSDTEQVYAWLAEESALVHRFLERSNQQIVETLRGMADLGIPIIFQTWAHEMLIPPWLSPRMFDEYVRPYDEQVAATIHGIGAKLLAHCHGRVMDYLVRFHDIGIDATEPLEPPPFGDVELGKAKRLIGDRMVLSGNIPSQAFVRMCPAEVRASVRLAVAAAAAGGGFTLRLTGGGIDLGSAADRDQLHRVIANTEAYIDSALEYGVYRHG